MLKCNKIVHKYFCAKKLKPLEEGSLYDTFLMNVYRFVTKRGLLTLKSWSRSKKVHFTINLHCYVIEWMIPASSKHWSTSPQFGQDFLAASKKPLKEMMFKIHPFFYQRNISTQKIFETKDNSRPSWRTKFVSRLSTFSSFPKEADNF